VRAARLPAGAGPRRGTGVSRRQGQFEVQVYQRDHWVIDCQHSDETSAVAYARAQVNQGRVEGVRVLKQWTRADGAVVENELFCQFRPQNNRIMIQTIEHAERCEAMPDYYGAESRMTVGRVLRSYLDQVVVTPTELMHNYAELKRLRDKDNLVPSAIGHVAQVQSGGTGGDTRGRRDEMFDVLEKMTERARLAAKADLPSVKSIAFDKMRRELSARSGADEGDYLSLVALSRELVGMRNWGLKMGFLLNLVGTDGDIHPDSMALIDGVMADILGSATMVQDLLGQQPNLAAAIISLADLADGKLDVSKRPGDDFAVPLNRLFAKRKVPATRKVLLDWLRRQLRGNQPLNRHEPDRERETFEKLAGRLIRPGGVVGGGAVAEGLTLRRMQFIPEGGQIGRQRAIEGVLADLRDAADKIRYLVALLGSGMAESLGEFIRGRISFLLADYVNFVNPHRSSKENLERLTKLWREMRDADAPPEDRAMVAGIIDELLVRYIEDTRLIEKLDDPTALLRYRAIRLIQLCASGALESPKALEIARVRVVDHLRQPNFEQKFVADIKEPEAQAQALKDFFALLMKAGFN
jgi:hypothetical protein